MADPYKYFRIEAGEILAQLQQGVLELERGAAAGAADTVARLLRLAHTLKGAARVVKQRQIADHSHAIEEILVPVREGSAQISGESIERLLTQVDAIGALTAALAAAPTPEPLATARAATSGGPRLPVEELFRAVHADLQDVEALMDGVAEVSFQVGSLRRSLATVERGRSLAELLFEKLDPRRSVDASSSSLGAIRVLAEELQLLLAGVESELASSIEQASRELGQVRGVTEQLRLVSASSMFGSLERTARDAAVSLGKQVRFTADGGEIRLDADVLSAVQRALVQAVRNALAHGIELPSERSAASKSQEGHVALEVTRRGRLIVFTCRDDGRGVDLAAVRQAVERRQPGGAAAGVPQLAKPELLRLLLSGGITTSTKVTEVSGRGIGLDLIREMAERIDGTLELQTEPGKGTSIELSVPASLTALEALLVESAGQISAIPLDAVRCGLRIRADELTHTAEGASLLVDGEMLPFVPLAWLLRKRERADLGRRSWSVVVVQGSAGAAALGVERMVGAENVVARALPDGVRLDPIVAGASLDADGDPRMLLDPDGLVSAARRALPAPAATETARDPILIIDDSLTTRMLEQSILESAGYEVELATSAEEGLEKARQRRYSLFLVDVEMPGMDGFTFVELTRSDPVLRQVPAILVTSRASPEDLQRGRAAGASAHIVKGEFDQSDFLGRIQRLVQ